MLRSKMYLYCNSLIIFTVYMFYCSKYVIYVAKINKNWQLIIMTK